MRTALWTGMLLCCTTLLVAEPPPSSSPAETLSTAIGRAYDASRTLKDCVVEVRRVRAYASEEHVFTGKLYWIAPDRSRTAAGNDSSANELRSAINEFFPAREFIALGKFLTETFELTESRDAEGTRLEGKPRDPAATGSVTVHLGVDGRMNHLTMTRPNEQGTPELAEIRFEYEERDGRLLLTCARMKAGDESRTVRWEYHTVAGELLTLRATEEAGKSVTTTEFTDPRVNDGSAAAGFEPK